MTSADLKEWAAEVARDRGVPPIVWVLRGILHGVCLADRARTDAKLLELQRAALLALEEEQR